MSDQERFEKDVGEEAHYWFTVSEFAELILKLGIDKPIDDAIQYIEDKMEKQYGKAVTGTPTLP